MLLPVLSDDVVLVGVFFVFSLCSCVHKIVLLLLVFMRVSLAFFVAMCRLHDLLSFVAMTPSLPFVALALLLLFVALAFFFRLVILVLLLQLRLSLLLLVGRLVSLWPRACDQGFFVAGVVVVVAG